jgi:hypothetical protein
MTILAIGSILLGTVLGRFYKFWVLLPASAFLFAVIYTQFAILEVAVLLTCLQVGYASHLLFCLIPFTWRRHKNPRQRTRPVAQIDSAGHVIFTRAAPSTHDKTAP